METDWDDYKEMMHDVRRALGSEKERLTEQIEQLDGVNEEALEQFLSNVSFISDEFSVEEFHKRLVVKRLAVIYISRCDHEVEQFPLLVTDQVQLEPEEPAHGALPPLGNALERLVDVDSLISAYPERSCLRS